MNKINIPAVRKSKSETLCQNCVHVHNQGTEKFTGLGYFHDQKKVF